MANTIGDSVTMLRRNLVRMMRYPVAAAAVIALPVVFLLLFVVVLGETLGAGLGAAAPSGAYIDYVVPGILLMAIAGGAQGTAISVAMDMNEGIIARFRTMAISRAAVLNGHVLGSVVQTMLGLVVVVGIAWLTGFRPDADFVEWVAVFGVMSGITLSITWLAVAMGVASKTVEGASNLPLPLVVLPLLGSGFVPTDSMPAGMRWFAEHQPFTPFIETVRGLLMGTPVGSSGLVSIIWCVAIALLGYAWALWLYNRRSVV
jgi:ABC-2 type transport system permease protein